MKRLLLVGAGHCHVEVVRRLIAEPWRDAEVVLVTPGRYTSYSGMLPGLIAGHYAFEDCHVDVAPLCARARVTLVTGQISGLDLARGCAHRAGGGMEAFDLLSLDIGSTPDMASLPGLPDHAIGAKPVAALLSAWEKIMATARARPLSIAVVGGGAGGVELALAIHYRLRRNSPETRVHLITDGATILPNHAQPVRRLLERILVQRGVSLHCASRVTGVEAGALRLAEGASLAADWIVWTTSASAPAWLAASGLATDARGFIEVNDHLQSASHPNVFAAGDCASLVGRSVPKAGVYAVRQGPVLAGNLRCAMKGKPLSRYIPQRTALALISAGSRHAVASWGPIAFAGDWVWRWKDRIDRRFMARYRTPVPAGPDG